MKAGTGVLWLSMFIMAMCGYAAADVYYVVPGGTGTTGASWADAFGSIQDAVAAASAASGGEVWVAAGTYTSTADPIVTMASGVDLYGGFAGTETSRDDRDWETNITNITGDSDGDSTGDRRCVSGADNAILDGFTLTKGYNSWAAGAMFSKSTSATVANCTFTASSAGFGGGVLVSTNSNVTFTNCAFTGNSATSQGGACFVDGSSQPAFSACTFGSNSAPNGGAIYFNEGAMSPAFTNCVFAGNTATGNGGAVNNTGTSLTPAFMNCTFANNSAANGGAMYNNTASAPVLTNCILWGDSTELHNVDATFLGSVTYSCIQDGFTGTGNISTDPIFVDGPGGDLRLGAVSPCIDTATSAGAPAVDILGRPRPTAGGFDMGAYESVADIRYVAPGGTGDGLSWATAFGSIQDAVNDLSSGEVWVAAGTYTATASPGVTMKPYVGIYGGFAGTETLRAMRDATANPTIIDGAHTYRCVVGASTAVLDGFIVQNGESSPGGGMRIDSCSQVAVTNCMFTGNHATIGGALACSSSSAILTHCSFVANTAGAGSAIFDIGGASRYVNSTFRENASSGSFGALYLSSSGAVFNGCGFEANSGGRGAAVTAMGSSGAPQFTNCIFTRNATSSHAGAICLIAGTCMVTNCSFTANTGSSSAVYVRDGGVINITNSILWGDSAEVYADPYHDEYTEAGTANISNSCVAGIGSCAGNFSMDPLFVDGTDDGDGFDLRLQPGSPCINTGMDTSGTTPDSAKDILGIARPQGPTYDMGAYEFATPSTVDFSASPTSGVVPLTVNFTDESTSGVAPVIGWLWDFGDGVSSTQQNPAHVYTAAGEYYVSLTAQTGSGNSTATKFHYIQVGRGAATVTAWPAAGAIVYGQPLSASSLDGGEASVAGTFAFARPDFEPEAGIYVADVTFTPVDIVNYSAASGTVDVDIAQAETAVTTPPAATPIALGQTLAASYLIGGFATAGTMAIAGTFTFNEPGALPDNPGTYSAAITFTPVDTANYLPAAGAVSVPVLAGECPICVETFGPYIVGGHACLAVPGTFAPEAMFFWEREDGTPLDTSRVAGIHCQRLQIEMLKPSDAGTYVCTYDDGTKGAAIYSVTIALASDPNVPAAPGGGGFVALALLFGLLAAWRCRRYVNEKREGHLL